MRPLSRKLFSNPFRTARDGFFVDEISGKGANDALVWQDHTILYRSIQYKLLSQRVDPLPPSRLFSLGGVNEKLFLIHEIA